MKTTIEGASAIVKDLKAMDDAAAQVMMQGAKAGGKIALEDAKRNCPVDSGALKAESASDRRQSNKGQSYRTSGL